MGALVAASLFIVLPSAVTLGATGASARPVRSASGSSPTVSLSTNAAGATGVTYTVDFTATSAIPAGGTITLLGPAGTQFQSTPQYYDLTDLTSSSGSFDGTSGNIAVGDPALPVFSFQRPGGAAVTITTVNAINANDALELQVFKVTNPGAGNDTLSVATSTDPTPVTSSSYTLRSPGSVFKPSVVLSTAAAGATDATYAIGFTTSASGSIAGFTPASSLADGAITLVAPLGTVFPSSNGDYSLTDATTPSANFSASAASVAIGEPLFADSDTQGSSVTISVPHTIKAGDSVTLTVTDVANPATGDTLSVATSADPVPAVSSSYTVQPPGSVSKPSLGLSTTAAGATDATYAVGFTTSASGAIAASTGEITLVGPPGTLWPGYACDYVITDSSNASGDSSCSNATLGDPGVPVTSVGDPGGAAVTLQVSHAIGASNALSLTVLGVTNPGAGTDTIKVATSSDPKAVTSSPYGITAASSVSKPTVSVSASAAGATANYTVGFSTSSTGGMPSYPGPAGSITVLAPAGTVLPTDCSDYTLTDSTEATGGFSTCSESVTVADNGSAATLGLAPSESVGAGDDLSLTVQNVTNPGEGNHTLSVATANDVVPQASASYAITGSASTLTAVSSATLSTSTTAAGASGATYAVTFMAVHGVTGGTGSVTLMGPPGTIFGGGVVNAWVFTDHTHATGSGSATATTDLEGGAVVSVTAPNTITSGDQVTLTATVVTNPLLGSGTLAIATSSDQEPVSVADSTTGPAAVGSPSLTTTSTAADANGVTDTINFTASTSGELVGTSSAITLLGPPGAFLGAGEGATDYTITDHTTTSGSGSATVAWSADNGSMLTVVPEHTIMAGDQVTLAITNAVNPVTASGDLSLSTSSDETPVALSDPTVTAASVRSPTLQVSANEAGANAVTYTVTFTTSSPTGALAGASGMVNLVGPVGTVFGACPYGCGGGNASYTFTDLTNPADSGPAKAVFVGGAGNLVSVVPTNSIGAGDTVSLTVTQVTNPLAGSASLQLSTSSDRAPVNVGQATTADTSVTAPGILASSATPGASGVTDLLSFTLSQRGALSGPQLGAITLVGPPGTVWPSSGTLTTYLGSQPATLSSFGTVDGGAVATYQPQTSGIPAGTRVLLTLTGVTNPSAGAPGATVATSSDPLGVSATPLAPLSGTVTFNNSPVANAPVQACETTGACQTLETSATGTFLFGVPDVAGSKYVLTADQAAFGTSASPVTLGPLTLRGQVGLTGLTLALGAPPALASGATLITPGGTETSSTAVPFIDWSQPFQVTLAASLFPPGTTFITELDITGVNGQTGQLQTIKVAPGGTSRGFDLPTPAGSPITVPALRPLHGAVSIYAHYLNFASSSSPAVAGSTGNLAQFLQGLGLTPPVTFLPGAPPQQVGLSNNAVWPDVTATFSGIIGPNAADFTVQSGGGSGIEPCNDVVLSEFGNVTAGPASACANQIGWTPNGSTPIEHATAVIKVGIPSDAHLGGPDTPPPPTASPTASATTSLTPGASDLTVLVPLTGCNPALTSQCAGGPNNNNNSSSGGTTSSGTSGGDGYSDPSGVVDGSTAHATAPLAGATVTLQQGPDTQGPFSAVPDGSAIMSPANRTNPSITGADGQYGWDTLAGAYRVLAAHSGCKQAHTKAVVVPPPATGLNLTLRCRTLPTLAPTSTTLRVLHRSVTVGAPVALHAAVAGSSPSGTVTFFDKGRSLGSAPVGTGGRASLTVATLPPGRQKLHAAYSGDGGHQASTSASKVVKVYELPKFLSAAIARLKEGTEHRVRVMVAAYPGATITLVRGTLPPGLRFVAHRGTNTALVTGTPRAAGRFSVTLKATNLVGSLSEVLVLKIGG